MIIFIIVIFGYNNNITGDYWLYYSELENSMTHSFQ